MKKVLKVIAICAIVALVSFCGYILIKDIKNNFNNKNGCRPVFMVGKILEINNNEYTIKVILDEKSTYQRGDVVKAVEDLKDKSEGTFHIGDVVTIEAHDSFPGGDSVIHIEGMRNESDDWKYILRPVFLFVINHVLC